MKNKLFMSKKWLKYFDLVFLLLENYEFWKYEMNKTEKTSPEKITNVISVVYTP